MREAQMLTHQSNKAIVENKVRSKFIQQNNVTIEALVAWPLGKENSSNEVVKSISCSLGRGLLTIILMAATMIKSIIKAVNTNCIYSKITKRKNIHIRV